MWRDSGKKGRDLDGRKAELPIKRGKRQFPGLERNQVGIHEKFSFLIFNDCRKSWMTRIMGSKKIFRLSREFRGRRKEVRLPGSGTSVCARIRDN